MDPEYDYKATDHGVRFYGVVTLGNLIMVAGAILPIIVWGIRLESRVDTEALLRSQLEKQVILRQADNDKRNNRIESLLDKINSDVTALRVQLGPARRSDPM